MNDLLYILLTAGILFADLCRIKVMRLPDGGHKMNVLYIVAGIISFILLVYLVWHY